MGRTRTGEGRAEMSRFAEDLLAPFVAGHGVIVLDGDGSLLMNLGSLATIGLLKPANLVVVVGAKSDGRKIFGLATLHVRFR